MIQQQARILANTEIAPGVFMMTAVSPQVAWHAQPGQFLHLRVGESANPLLRRPLSIFRVDSAKEQVTLVYGVVGRGTEALGRLLEGGILDLIGPLGNGFSVPSGTRMALLVAGGLGVAPLFFLAEVLHRNSMPLRFLMGARSRDKLLVLEELRALGIHPLVSTDDGSQGFCGPVTELLEKTLLEEKFEPDSCFLCSAGPQPMLSQVVALGRRHGVVGQVSLEQRMGCGLGACWGCVIPCLSSDGRMEYRRVCSDGPVFNMDEVLLQR